MDLPFANLPTPLQLIHDPVVQAAGVTLYVKRDDLIHATVSGNKFRKLKYNLADALENEIGTLLTFGGAYSNHLYATAAAGSAMGFKTIGVVRGEDHEKKETPTLRFCREMGMEIHYVSRQEYRLRNETEYLQQLEKQFGKVCIIPEGGTTARALPGVAELVSEVKNELNFTPEYFAVATGTGGTAAGILSAGADVLAFSALKGGAFLEDDIAKLLAHCETTGKLTLFTDYHFGGYARFTPGLLNFIREFKGNHGIQLEQVYTAKMMYGLLELVKNKYFRPGTRIVAVHTGGLQGLLAELH